MYKGMFLYPWDLADEGVDAVSGRLRDAGLNTAVVAASYHAGKFLRPHAPGGRVVFPDDGTIYFRSTPGRYRETPLRPAPNQLLEEQDVFAALSAGRARTGLDLAAWFVCLHNTRLGTGHPAHVVRNAYGDPYYFSLCPSHPEVSAYVRALLADFATTVEAQHVILETPGFLPYEHGFHHEFSLVEANAWTAALLALCFCSRCQEQAAARGLDGAHVASDVRAALDRYYGDATLPSPSADQAVQWITAEILSDPELTAYLRMRMDVVTGLVREVRAALPPSVRLAVIPSVSQPLALAWLEGSDLAGLARAADAVQILGYRVDPSDVHADTWWARRQIGERARLHVVLRPSHPDCPDEGNLSQKVGAVLEGGANGIAFYNYGHIRLGHLAWVRRALERFEPCEEADGV